MSIFGQGRRSAREATAVFSDAFQFPGTTISPDAPEVIERDRLVMAARPGMVRKLLPIREDPTGVYCGGCYLFDTWEHARDYGRWVAEEFRMDGALFLDRPEFLEPTSQLWRIAGIEDFADRDRDQTLMRFQRWHLPGPITPEELRAAWWPRVRGSAQAAGLSGIWLLAGTDPYHAQLGVVLVGHGVPDEQGSAFAADLAALESLPSPGAPAAAALGGTKVFDRTSWIYMIWHPIREGDGAADTASWPVSPPYPGPGWSLNR